MPGVSALRKIFVFVCQIILPSLLIHLKACGKVKLFILVAHLPDMTFVHLWCFLLHSLICTCTLDSSSVFPATHNTLRRHLHLIGLSDSPLCRRCGAEEETSVHILCECEVLASLRHAYLGSFFLESEESKSLNLWAIWNFSKVTGLP